MSLIMNGNVITNGRITTGPNVVTKDTIIYVDAGNVESYPGSGTIWSDISGNGFNGTLTNGPTFNPSNYGNIVFDGSDDYVSFGDNNSYTNPNGFSINIWFKPASYGGANPLLEKYQPGGYEFVFGTLFDNLYGWVYDNDTNGYTGRYLTNLSNFIPLDTWGNFAYTYDGGGIPSSSKIYINGIQRDTTDFDNSSFITIRNTNTDLTIGRYNTGIGGPMNGSVGLMNFYSRTLTEDEIIQNYNEMKFRYEN